MSWSIRLGTLSGIPVYLHVTFLLLLGFIALTQLLQAGLGAAVGSVLLISSVFGLVVLHEMGHALAARRFGIGTLDVTLLPFGGLARLERMPRNPHQELWIALAGPAVNLAIAGLIGVVLLLTGYSGAIGLTSSSFLAQLMAINLVLFAFNMLPAFPMDGGRVLRALLARRMGHLPATEIAVAVGKGLAIVLGFVGLFWNLMLVFIAMFVWFAGNQELAATRFNNGPPGGWAPPADRGWPDDDRGGPQSPRAVRVWVRQNY